MEISLEKIENFIGNKDKTGKRQEEIKNFGYSVKYAYHLVRLLNEVEMILSEGDLDLRRNAEQLKSIRRGDCDETQVYDYFNRKELALEELYNKSTLRYEPDESSIKSLLLNCLEAHYGSLQNCVNVVDKYENCCKEINNVLRKYDV